MPNRRSTVSRPEVPPRRGRRFGAIMLAAVLALAACDGGAAPAPTAGPNGVALLSSAAVTATVGPAGGELTTADPDRGRSYRVTIPEGAVGEDVEVTATPIVAIDGLDGTFLGGVELEPDGLVVARPVTVEIALAGDQQAALKSALEAGEPVSGVQYDGAAVRAADELWPGVARAAGDASSVTITTYGFSGHLGRSGGGALPASFGQTGRYYHQYLNVQGDPGDPAVLAQYFDIFGDWADAIIADLPSTADDPRTFVKAVSIAILDLWYGAAHDLGFLSEVLFVPGDDLAPEAMRLRDAVDAVFADAWDAANDFCEARKDLGHLESLYVAFTAWPEGVAPDSLPAWTFTPAFCVQLLLVNLQPPADLNEGDTQEILVDVHASPDGIIADLADLVPLGLGLDVREIDPSLVSGGPIPRVDGSVGFGVIARALRAVSGSTSEGALTVHLELLGQADFAAPLPMTFDILELQSPSPSDCTGAVGPATGPVTVAYLVEDQCTPPPAITCAGDPATTTYRTDERVSILFDGTTCSLVLDADDPNDVLDVDSDESLVGWNAETGTAWSVSGVGDREQPGPYSILITRTSTGETYQLSFTVDVEDLGGGDIRITVRDVTISPASSEV